MKCKCQNPSCAKQYDPQETSRIHGEVPWLYRFCSAPCFTQVIMKKITTNQFVLYEPVDDNVIAGPVKASNRGDAAIELLSEMGYEVIMVEDETGDKDGQG